MNGQQSLSHRKVERRSCRDRPELCARGTFPLPLDFSCYWSSNLIGWYLRISNQEPRFAFQFRCNEASAPVNTAIFTEEPICPRLKTRQILPVVRFDAYPS